MQKQQTKIRILANWQIPKKFQPSFQRALMVFDFLPVQMGHAAALTGSDGQAQYRKKPGVEPGSGGIVEYGLGKTSRKERFQGNGRGLVGLVNVVCSFFSRKTPGKVCAAITVCP